ncbi:DNA polymerase I [Nitrosospira multiformis ATCC 25196]|uniref:DNA polymerase I n=1 Tax=Nitrosospira multiformis (strain ATCC 25196 / NCIMB 11849 / C 71) TaxID=323848 RepID=Q2YBJ5_NITMU|nr:DNA polymerase I [Nitrosospira multiformis]ABB73876.1 DNA polymerase I [Nitrosospira multiformis ATCC 25196]SEF98096.1 DNA polymerase I [Nitrosospira multiformis ATCC 25196]
MKTLLLVDGSSYLYRAFHALPDFRNRNNEPTGAVYGVLNMLRRLHKDYQADYSACVFDAKGKTFRDELYAEYKANRPPMPDELAAQIAPLLECINAMGWPMLSVEGVEADDVIGTLVKQAEGENMRCIISTGDKDIAQLVNPQVTLVNTMTNEMLDEAGVLGRFGVPPERMLDYLALVGDAVDNIPGVAKVGPKTAVKWLNQYGTLDNLLVHAGEIGGVVGENLRNALGWLSRSRQLLSIKCDVSLPVSLHDLGPQPPDMVKLAELYERLDFKSWLRELQQESQAEGAADALSRGFAPAGSNLVQADYQTILTPEQLDEWMMRIAAAPLASLDTETTGLDPMRAELVGISFSVEPHHGAYIPLGHRYTGVPRQLPLDFVLEKLKPWLTDPSAPKLGQNLKFDRHVFANHGIGLKGIVHDTLLQSYVFESHRPHDMDNLALRHLGIKTITYDEVTGKGAARIGFEQVDIERAAQYAAEDADVTLQLHQHLYAEVGKDAKLDHIYRTLEMPVMDVLFEMERNGVLLDIKLLETQSRELGEKMLALEERACTIAGLPFNLNSPKQIQEILFDRLKLPVMKKTPSGVPSTDEDVLQKLALDYPLARALLDYRGLAKLKSTYTDKLPRMVHPVTGRVHTNYAQAVAVTGRLASNEPNLQNIPIRTAEGRRIREAFIAPSGYRIISADYSQIELRIMAHISQDAGLLKAFAQGEDIHRATGSEIFGVPLETVNSEQRRYAKIINFGLIYGMSEFGLATQLGIERAAARTYMDRYFSRYPGVADYMQRTRKTARENRYVETVFGRRLWLSEINSSNGMRRQAAERAAINAPMQGTAADIIKLAMIEVHDWLRRHELRSKLVMQVHDELVLEVPENEIETIKRELPLLMGNVAQLQVPLLVEVGVGPNWEQAH